jgi:hypothetical protein
VKGKELLKDTCADVGETSGSLLDEKKAGQLKTSLFLNNEADFLNEQKNDTNAVKSFSEATQVLSYLRTYILTEAFCVDWRKNFELF